MKLLTKKDCLPNSHELGFEGKVMVLPGETLLPEYGHPKYQLVRALAGFGCQPFLRGKAVAVIFLADGERCGMRRDDFLGILSPETEKRLRAEGLEVNWDAGLEDSESEASGVSLATR